METVLRSSSKYKPLGISNCRKIRPAHSIRTASRNRAAHFMLFKCATCSNVRPFGFAVAVGMLFNPYPTLECEPCGTSRLHEFVRIGFPRKGAER